MNKKKQGQVYRIRNTENAEQVIEFSVGNVLPDVPRWGIRKVLTGLADQYPQSSVVDILMILNSSPELVDDWGADIRVLIQEHLVRTFLFFEDSVTDLSDVQKARLWVLACWWHQYANGPRPGSKQAKKFDPNKSIQKKGEETWRMDMRCQSCGETFPQAKDKDLDKAALLPVFVKWMAKHVATCPNTEWGRELIMSDKNVKKSERERRNEEFALAQREFEQWKEKWGPNATQHEVTAIQLAQANFKGEDQRRTKLFLSIIDDLNKPGNVAGILTLNRAWKFYCESRSQDYLKGCTQYGNILYGCMNSKNLKIENSWFAGVGEFGLKFNKAAMPVLRTEK